ncbi:hypothetical protein [Nostoc sp.]
MMRESVIYQTEFRSGAGDAPPPVRIQLGILYDWRMNNQPGFYNVL